MELLHQGVTALGLTLPETAQARLLDYLALLSKWNRVYNLTAVRGDAAKVTQHLLDSLAVLPWLDTAQSLADVGSGAGLPGLVLAIARPDLQVTSIEASQKKAAFQQQARIEMGLNNVTIYAGRVEDHPAAAFDAVIARAFSSLADFVALAGRLAGAGGKLLAMKGQLPTAELAALPPGWRAQQTARLEVPGLAAERHLIVLERTE